MKYVDYVYDIVRLDTIGLDAIYKDYIIQMVGVYGFNALFDARLIEMCGYNRERQLYVLLDKKDVVDKDISEIEELKKENKKLKDLLMKGFV